MQIHEYKTEANERMNVYVYFHWDILDYFEVSLI